MNTQKRYKVGCKVRLLRAANPGDQAVILERITQPTISTGQYSSSRGGVLGTADAARYRVQVVRTGQELLQGEEWLEPCDGTQYETE